MCPQTRAYAALPNLASAHEQGFADFEPPIGSPSSCRVARRSRWVEGGFASEVRISDSPQERRGLPYRWLTGRIHRQPVSSYCSESQRHPPRLGEALYFCAGHAARPCPYASIPPRALPGWSFGHVFGYVSAACAALPPAGRTAVDRGRLRSSRSIPCACAATGRRGATRCASTRRRARWCSPSRRAAACARRKEFAQKHGAWIAARLKRLPQATPFAHDVDRAVPRRAASRRASARRARHGLDREGEGGERLICVAGEAPHHNRRIGDFLKREARRDLDAASRRYAEELGVTIKRISVRDQSSRWGSCSNTGVLSFSWRLILAPPYVLDYLAAHEVAHLVELNHSPKFWRLLKRLNPDCERAKAWLDIHGTDLHRYRAGRTLVRRDRAVRASKCLTYRWPDSTFSCWPLDTAKAQEEARYRVTDGKLGLSVYPTVAIHSAQALLVRSFFKVRLRSEALLILRATTSPLMGQPGLLEFTFYWFVNERMKGFLERFDPTAFEFLKCEIKLPNGSAARLLAFDVVRVLETWRQESKEKS